MKTTKTETLFREYAVEIHDEDAATTIIVNEIWLSDKKPDNIDKRTENIAKSKYDHIFAGNHCIYSNLGLTGRYQIVTAITDLHDKFNDDFKDVKFFELTE